MGVPKHDANGRVTTAEFEKFWLVTTYVPNSGQGLVNLEYRTKEWEVDFRAYLQKLGESKVGFVNKKNHISTGPSMGRFLMFQLMKQSFSNLARYPMW